MVAARRLAKAGCLILFVTAALSGDALGGPDAPGGPKSLLEPIEVPAASNLALAVRRPITAVTSAGNRVVCVGEKGHILYSDDQGRTWTQAKVPVSVDLVAVHFPEPLLGWATGHDGVILRSVDGGETWSLAMDGRRAAKLMADHYGSQQRADSAGERIEAALDESLRFVEEEGARPFLDVWFRDKDTGFVVGAWGLILHTRDGGQNWEPWLHRIDNPEASSLYAIGEAGRRLWIVGETGLVASMGDGERDFAAAGVAREGSLFGFLPLADGVLVYGLGGRVVTARAPEGPWIPARGLDDASGITGGTVLPDGRIVLVDVGGRAWVSRDEGAAFSPLSVSDPMPYAGVVHAGPDRLVLVGIGGVRVADIAH